MTGRDRVLHLERKRAQDRESKRLQRERDGVPARYEGRTLPKYRLLSEPAAATTHPSPLVAGTGSLSSRSQSAGVDTTGDHTCDEALPSASSLRPAVVEPEIHAPRQLSLAVA